MANPELMTMMWIHSHELLGDWDRYRFTESESEVFAPAQARAPRQAIMALTATPIGAGHDNLGEAA